ncbi:hypothetical protein ACUW9N_002175 [Staphylococcus auricularis]|nr:hypothetical protein JCM2421_14640 [Staphylococcus auricularis]SQJ13767.1 Bacteriophage [Staphylococcus auricularis]
MMHLVDDELVEQFKDRNRIFYDIENERIKNDLELSYQDIQGKCGVFDLNDEPVGRELVLERTRYVLNDQLEHFHDNFLSMILQFQFDNMDVTFDE